MEKQENIFNVSKIELKLRAELKYIYNLIERSVDEEKPIVSEDGSTIVYVIDVEKEKVENKYDFQTVVDRITKKSVDMLPGILNVEFKCNKIICSELNVDERVWEVPLLWWNFPEKILTNILLRRWLVLTWFNEDYLLNELNRKGFQIHRNKKEISIDKKIGNTIVGIDDLSMFIKMAAKNFVEVKSVVDIIENVIDNSVFNE